MLVLSCKSGEGIVVPHADLAITIVAVEAARGPFGVSAWSRITRRTCAMPDYPPAAEEGEIHDETA